MTVGKLGIIDSIPMPLRLVAQDTFTRANSTDLGSTEVGGFAWGEQGGNPQIVGNAMGVTPGYGGMFAAFDAGVSDCQITAHVRTCASGKTRMAVLCRTSTGAPPPNRWEVLMLDDNGSIHDLRLVRSIWNEPDVILGSYAAGFGPAQDHEIVVVMNGGNWMIYLDGTLRITANDATHATQTRFGFHCLSSGAQCAETEQFYDIKVET